MSDIVQLCVHLPCLLLVGVLGMTFHVWAWTSSHPEWYQELEAETPLANTTLHIPQPCNGSNWSAGSAFFTLTALTFGYISHPRGCMIFDRSGRIWRLSPLFALMETCLLWKRIIGSALNETGPSFRVVCHALMAVRISNSWHPSEIKSILELEQRHDEQRETPARPTSPEVLTWQQRRIRKALEEVAKFEHGPSYRIFIWIPMVLQIIKLLLVSGSGSLLTKLSGWVYFIAWATIEVLMITSAQRPLQLDEHTSAISLCQSWTRYHHATALTEDVHFVGMIFEGFSGFYNILFTLDLLWPNRYIPIRYIIIPRGFFRSAGYVIEILVGYVVLALAFAVVGFFVAFPSPVLLYQIVLLRVWNVFGRVTKLDFGPLWFESYAMELQPLWPAYIATYNFVTLMLFHTGIWSWHPFECWETRQPWFYDWLG